MRNKLVTFAALMLLTLAGVAGTPTLHAQARPTLTQNIDEPGRTPFQATVLLDISKTGYASIPIPPGKRLVVDYVSASAAAASTQGAIEPIFILTSSVAGSGSAQYYFPLTRFSPLLDQYSQSGPVAIYSDTLAVGLGYAGYTPSFLIVNVVVSGHLISNPIAP